MIYIIDMEFNIQKRGLQFNGGVINPSKHEYYLSHWACSVLLIRALNAKALIFLQFKINIDDFKCRGSIEIWWIALTHHRQNYTIQCDLVLI